MATEQQDSFEDTLNEAARLVELVQHMFDSPRKFPWHYDAKEIVGQMHTIISKQQQLIVWLDHRVFELEEEVRKKNG